MRGAARNRVFSTAAPFPSAAWRGPWQNMGESEQTASIAAGALVTLWGLGQRGVFGRLLGVAAGGALIARGATGHSLIYSRLMPTPAERRIARQHGWSTAAAVARSVTIARPRAELYAFFRDFANLPRIMDEVERVDVRDERHTHWVVRAPAGHTVEWDAIQTGDTPDALIAWESAPGADIRNSGRVEFSDAPGGRGTEVRASIAYEPPGGQLGRALARVLGQEPAVQTRRALDRFKQIMETGEVASNAMRGDGPVATPHGNG